MYDYTELWMNSYVVTLYWEEWSPVEHTDILKIKLSIKLHSVFAQIKGKSEYCRILSSFFVQS